ncbi:WcaA Glycosyltransferases involved in cell wall biogenesis [Caulobacteraceae bacterium]|jgi:glycosyltransferase involved in cell wall biosynthesis
MSVPLSIFIITKNEVDRLGPTLESVKGLSSDIVVVDSGSTDGTQELAERLGARVIFNPWPGYGLQKQFGEDQCRHDWLLNIDADEVVTLELAASIEAAIGRPDLSPCGFETDIIEMFPGEARPHAWAFRLSPVRLYHKKVGRYSSSPVHDRVDLAKGTPVHRLNGVIEHRSIRSLGHELIKLNAYADMQADDLDKKGRKIGAARLVAEFPLAFLKAYIARRHFVRGLYGFMTAMNYAFYRYLRLAKYWERRLGR